MSRLKPTTEPGRPREIARGPYFELVREENHNWRKAVCILSDHEPTDAEIHDTAEATVRRWNRGYRCRHFWRRIVESEPQWDGLTGTPARLEVERRIGRLAERLAPAEPPAAPKLPSQADLDRIGKPVTPPERSGPHRWVDIKDEMEQK